MRAEDILYGRSRVARIVQMAMHPFSTIFGSMVGLRNYLYDSGRIHAVNANIPVVSVGNISVGGTGKTPVTAWLAEKFLRAGIKPGVILRGYGGDEQLVHQHLNPEAAVIASPDRMRATVAAHSLGARVAILDDAFQHRRINRGWDIVLLSADRWNEKGRLLPAGDLREPIESLSRANLIVITRKAAPREKALAIEKAIRTRFRNLPVAVALLAPSSLRDKAGNEIPLQVLNGAKVLAFSAVGDNDAFEAQLGERGADIRFRSFRDHHAFSDRDVAGLAAESADVQYVVCTLKDAVKVWPKWPADAKPLWYVSQTLVLESGAGALDELIGKVSAVIRD